MTNARCPRRPHALISLLSSPWELQRRSRAMRWQCLCAGHSVQEALLCSRGTRANARRLRLPGRSHGSFSQGRTILRRLCFTDGRASRAEAPASCMY
ncbi:hypothetical protein COCCADRAFT_82954 [Bipolaris zeicola 26-R-13]|uniref:Uncharacterized protein n=1 Tax=Cochliobolus carbonum (strain 26-R-13) TaxID=930089 RepID=W6YG33_COCC2|nr:uncharacterized protein COCCADRAFT_82954 [Bipolaris zeicola 26-R-13]EUC38442.1 hypothetical protein COCCADRAFT_82954 [Bipolaris zeicola 26-R-13]